MELTTEDMVVRVCSSNDSGAYVFRCPECRMAVTKGAEERIIELLVNAGVTLQMWTLPDELNEQRVGEPFDHDDLLEFHELLADEDWMASLLSTPEGS